MAGLLIAADQAFRFSLGEPVEEIQNASSIPHATSRCRIAGPQ
jgi:hypothetical protein